MTIYKNRDLFPYFDKLTTIYWIFGQRLIDNTQILKITRFYKAILRINDKRDKNTKSGQFKQKLKFVSIL